MTKQYYKRKYGRCDTHTEYSEIHKLENHCEYKKKCTKTEEKHKEDG